MNASHPSHQDVCQLSQSHPRLVSPANQECGRFRPSGRSSQKNIYSSTLVAGGSTWAANKKVSENTAAVKDFPDMAVGSDGTSDAVWQDSRRGSSRRALK